MSPEISSRAQLHAESEDAQIIQITSDLCLTMKIDNFSPKAIRWVTWLIVPHGRLMGNLLVPSDQCFFEDNDLALAKTLRGRLTPDEWKPLIASSLIFEYDKGIRRKYTGQRPLRFIPIFAATVLLLVLLRLGLPGVQLPVLPTIGVVLSVLFAISIFFWDFSLARQKLRLRCDRRALKVVDRAAFLKTLSKIDGMGLADIESRKREKSWGWNPGRSQWPSITKRIASLQTA